MQDHPTLTLVEEPFLATCVKNTIFQCALPLILDALNLITRQHAQASHDQCCRDLPCRTCTE